MYIIFSAHVDQGVSKSVLTLISLVYLLYKSGCPSCSGNILELFVAGSLCLVTLCRLNWDSIYIGACWSGLAWAHSPGPVAES